VSTVLLVVVASIVLVYAVGWVRLGRRSALSPSPWRPACTVAGLATILVSLGSPLDVLAHERFVVHMLQHMLLTTVAAPLLVLADPFPAALWALPRGLRKRVGRVLVRRARVRALWRVLTTPVAAWLAHALTLWLWHVPALYNAALNHPELHVAQHLTFLATAVLFWWPVVAPAPRVTRPPTDDVRLVYLVLGAFQAAALGVLLAASPRPLYAAYAGAVDALADQARGGVVMWGLGGAVDMLAVMIMLWRFLQRHGGLAASAVIDRSPPVRENEAVWRMLGDPLIRVTGVRKAFGGHLVLDDVTLEVRSGEALALLGPNGAGKTTLLRILATLGRPARGAVSVVGIDCLRQPEAARQHFGLLAHGSWVYEDLTALENLRFWTTLAALRLDADALRAALAAVELDRVADDRVRTFSLGMKRRLALARFVLARPQVLLLDEPFAGLDQQAGKWLDDHLDAFKARGGAILMTTHSFGRGLGVADRIAILSGGRIVLDRPATGLTGDEVRRLYALHVEEGA
jgi:heme ABC exporter ATP-binding subunit CcmA